MFGLFKKKQDGGNGDLKKVAERLKEMGYDLTPLGESVAMLGLKSGYNDAETASHIALTTMALDLRIAGSDVRKVMSYYPHTMTLLETLKNYKDKGMMRDELWKNDSNALLRVSTIDLKQEAWIAQVLSDPIAGKERLATSPIK